MVDMSSVGDELRLHRSFLMYAVFLLFISTADAIMSYAAPVIMEETLGNATWMGVILASSSFAGMIMDFSFARLFPAKRFAFFLRIVLSLVILFPLSLLVYRAVPSFLFGMIVWGVYFEAWIFSNFHAIHEFVHPDHHAWAWGVLSTLRNVALVVGPFLAASFGGATMQQALYIALVFYGVGIILFLLSKRLNPLRSESLMAKWGEGEHHGFWQEIRIWRTYIKAIWPVVVFSLLIYLIDSAFYTTGPMFSEQLKTQSPFGVLFVSLYSIPGLVVGMFTARLARPYGKKRAAFIAGIISGFLLLCMALTRSPILILLFDFLASIGLCIIFPEIDAVFEDFVARSGKLGNDVIGLTAIAGSIGYVVGPIVNGIVMDAYGPSAVFGSWGVILLATGAGLLIVTRRKIHLPQQELTQVALEIEPAAS